LAELRAAKMGDFEVRGMGALSGHFGLHSPGQGSSDRQDQRDGSRN
jgi:hypothetical protein